MSEETTTADAPAEAATAEVPAKFKDLVTEIEKMSVLDLSELVKCWRTNSAYQQQHQL